MTRKSRPANRKRKERKERFLVHAADGVPYSLLAQSEEPGLVSDDVTLDLVEALVGVFLWPGLPVTVQRVKRINLIERFTLEAALTLGAVTAEELSALTKLPAQSIRPLLGRLLASGALMAAGPGRYAPTDDGEDILLRETVVVEEHGHQDFAYFPATDELLALTKAVAQRPKDLFNKKMRPATYMPVPEELRAETPSAVVTRHLAAGTAYECPPEVTGAAALDDEEPLGDICPAYLAQPVTCRHAPETGQSQVDLTLHGHKWDVRVRLAGVNGLVATWERFARLVERPEVAPLLWAAITGAGGSQLPRDVAATLTVQPSDSDSSPRYTMMLPEEAARELRASNHLGEVVGLRVDGEQTVLRIKVGFQPADVAAARLFATDHAAILLGTGEAASVEAAITDAAKEYALEPGVSVDPDEALDRTWQLEHYQAIYALRESHDFGYD